MPRGDHDTTDELVELFDAMAVASPPTWCRAAELGGQMVEAAVAAGVEASDLPGLRGLCVEAVRCAERHGR